MKYTEEEKEAIQKINSFKSIKLLYGKIYAMHLEQLKKYQTASEIILNLLDKQQKEIDRLELEIKDLKSKTQIISPLYVKENYVLKGVIREKIEELKDNRPYLSKFDDWKEKEYTNEDINNMCVEVLEDLLGE